MRLVLNMLLLVWLAVLAGLIGAFDAPGLPGVSGIPGAPVAISPADPRVSAVLNYALVTGYPQHNYINASVISATQQVVNGLLYQLIVAVQFPNSCMMMLLSVWQRASPPGWYLTQQQPLLNLPCPINMPPHVPLPAPTPPAAGPPTGMPGAPVPIDPTDPRVSDALKFALETGYPMHQYMHAVVVSATEQVVNGVLYELIVAVTCPRGICIMVLMSVWERASPPGRYLTQHQVLNVPCPPPPATAPKLAPKSRPGPVVRTYFRS